MRQMCGFFKKELITLFRDPVLVVAVLIMPAVQLVVLSGAITLEAKNLRIAVDSGANDMFMEKIYNHAIGSGWFVAAPTTDKDAVSVVQSGGADVAIVAPDGGLSRAIGRGSGRVQVLIDSMNILKAQSIEGYLQGVMAAAARDMGYDLGRSPIAFDVRILFNPELDTKWFMVPSLVATLVFVSLLMLITTSIAKEKENGTMEMLISCPISKYDIIFGKVIPYVLISFLVMLSVLGIGLVAFGMPFVGSWIMFLMAFVVFCVPGTAIAVLLANYTKNQQQAMLGIIIVAFLCLMLSGAMIPTENMPLALQYISYINPLSHYSYLVRGIILKGPTFAYFWPRALVMGLVGGALWFIAIKKFKTTL